MKKPGKSQDESSVAFRLAYCPSRMAGLGICTREASVQGLVISIDDSCCLQRIFALKA